MSEQLTRQAPASVAVNDGAAVGALASVKVLDHNNSRTSYYLSNDGGAEAWLSEGTDDAVAHKGVHLPVGSSYLADDWVGEVHVYSTAGTTVCWVEKSFAVGDDEGERVSGADAFVPSGPSDEPPTASLSVTGE